MKKWVIALCCVVVACAIAFVTVVNNKNVRMNELNQDLTEIQAEVNTLKEENEKSAKTIQDLNLQVESLTAERDELTAENGQLAEALDGVNRNLSSAQEKVQGVMYILTDGEQGSMDGLLSAYMKIYTDVPSNSDYFFAVDYVTEHQLMDAASEETFGVDEPATLGELAEGLWKLDGKTGTRAEATEALLALTKGTEEAVEGTEEATEAAAEETTEAEETAEATESEATAEEAAESEEAEAAEPEAAAEETAETEEAAEATEPEAVTEEAAESEETAETTEPEAAAEEATETEEATEPEAATEEAAETEDTTEATEEEVPESDEIAEAETTAEEAPEAEEATDAAEEATEATEPGATGEESTETVEAVLEDENTILTRERLIALCAAYCESEGKAIPEIILPESEAADAVRGDLAIALWTLAQ